MQECVVLRSGLIEIGDCRRRLQGAMEGVRRRRGGGGDRAHLLLTTSCRLITED